MIKVGIVILNYLVYQDTIAFIETIKQQNQENIDLKIVIADNASGNESVAVLTKKYSENPQIKIVVAEKNLGFAGGNNMGYLALLEEMTPDYVIVANDDILLREQGLFDWIQAEDAAYQYGVLGPKVYSLKGDCYQSPMSMWSQDVLECKQSLVGMQHALRSMRWKKPIKKLLKRDSKAPEVSQWKAQEHQTHTTQMTLHGAFLVFSRRYLDVFSLPFDTQTFLYMEEHILRLRCQNAGLVMLYSPSYEVAHLQATATHQVNKSNLDMQYFKMKYRAHSLTRYIELLEECKEIYAIEKTKGRH